MRKYIYCNSDKLKYGTCKANNSKRRYPYDQISDSTPYMLRLCIACRISAAIQHGVPTQTSRDSIPLLSNTTHMQERPKRHGYATIIWAQDWRGQCEWEYQSPSGTKDLQCEWEIEMVILYLKRWKLLIYDDLKWHNCHFLRSSDKIVTYRILK